MPYFWRFNSQIGLLLCFIALFTSCSKDDKQPPFGMAGAPGANMPPAEVGYITLKQETIDRTVELPGRVSPFAAAEIRPQVNGIILKRMFEEGSLVKAGQQLYQIDPAVYQAAYDTAAAQLARSNAVVTSSSSLEKKYKKLLEIHAVSQQEYIDALASFHQAQADVTVAQAAKQTAQINLNYTKVFSPISGRIGKSSVTAGALVTANQTTPLALVQQLDPVYVDVTQSSTDLLKLKQKMAEKETSPAVQAEAEVKLILDDLNYEYEKIGILKFSDVTVDKETGSVLIRAIFPNPDNKLLPGLFVRAIIKQDQINNAVLIPQQSITRNPDGSAVAWIIDNNNKIQTVPVELGEAIKDKWLVTKGLEASQKVVVEGLIKIKTGAKVKPVDISTQGGALQIKSLKNKL